MKRSQMLYLVTVVATIFGFVNRINASDVSGAPAQVPIVPALPIVPQLPTGPITESTVDCVNSKFFKIQKENPELKTWLSDVQNTVERLFAVRKKCDGETRKDECISAWNRLAGVEFLRLGLTLFDQKTTTTNPLEILNTFLKDFQVCW